jgi:kumamolisin
MLKNTKLLVSQKQEKTQPISTTWILNKDTMSSQVAWDLRIFCEKNGLTVKRINPTHLIITGLAEQHAKIHKIELNNYSAINTVTEKNITYRGLPLNTDFKKVIANLPASIRHCVKHVLGLSNAPVASPRYHVQKDATGIPHELQSHFMTAFTPPQLATIYNFPLSTCTGQKIGIIELGGGYLPSDITAYLAKLGINVEPNITDVSVDGAVNDISDYSLSMEVTLDIEIAVAIAPQAAFRVYFCPNTDRGFYNGILRAYQDGCNIISISWGAAEIYWDSSTLDVYNSLLQTLAENNCTVFVAAGDNGSVDFPASSPYSVSCGGTRLVSNGINILQEAVWNGGGGISNYFDKPEYQSNVQSLTTKRGVPDIAANADPNTGYLIYFFGEQIVVGGTSAVSPLLAGLQARVNANIGYSAGFIHPVLYGSPDAFSDITIGNNGLYQASSGWDLCTGNGRPIGTVFQNSFGPAPVVPLDPIASFEAFPNSGVVPLAVTFSDVSTGDINERLWTFGDGTISTGGDSVHVYQTPGIYTVSLQVTNNLLNSTETKTDYIIVSQVPEPTVAFIAQKLTGIAPFTVNFINNSTNGVSFLWDFGDGTSSLLKNPIHIYNKIGIYSIILTVANNAGTKTLKKKRYIIVK